MTVYKIKKYEWRCPSCGLPLMLTISTSESNTVKWIKSKNISWPIEMKPGYCFGQMDRFDCALCHTEFNVEETTETIKSQEGKPFGKE